MLSNGPEHNEAGPGRERHANVAQVVGNRVALHFVDEGFKRFGSVAVIHGLAP
jgi:hypothetical protein